MNEINDSVNHLLLNYTLFMLCFDIEVAIGMQTQNDIVRHRAVVVLFCYIFVFDMKSGIKQCTESLFGWIGSISGDIDKIIFICQAYTSLHLPYRIGKIGLCLCALLKYRDATSVCVIMKR